MDKFAYPRLDACRVGDDLADDRGRVGAVLINEREILGINAPDCYERHISNCITNFR